MSGYDAPATSLLLADLVESASNPTYGVFSRQPTEPKLAILVFMSIYETAKAGGPHYGFWKEKSKLPNHLIEKSIRSIEKQIALHQSWIAKPYSKLPPDTDSRQVADLVNEK